MGETNFLAQATAFAKIAGGEHEEISLQRYLKDQPFCPESWDVLEWVRHNPEVAEAMGTTLEELGREFEEEGYLEHDHIDQFVQAISEDDKERIVRQQVQQDPTAAPSWAYLDDPTRVKADTWLIHFSDQAQAIQEEGFTRGVEQADRLGLTTWLSKQEKAYGGYNFAFRANSRDARQAARQGSYGGEAVMFMAGGVEAYHIGDQENQVIFWGPKVLPSDLVHLYKVEGEWCVYPAKAYRDCIFKGEFPEVVQWVDSNWAQYRKAITRRASPAPPKALA